MYEWNKVNVEPSVNNEAREVKWTIVYTDIGVLVKTWPFTVN